MKHDDIEYLETKAGLLINRNFSVAGVLTKKLITIIYKQTGGDPISYLLDKSDLELEEYEDETFNIQNITKNLLLGLIETIINENI